MSGSMERLGNRYRLVDCIGTGGMSVVWLARDEILGRDVVVKLLGPQRDGDDSSRDLIRQEAMAAAGLAHPNVTTVYDYGEVDFPDGETVPYVVMEYVRGRTLASRLAEGPMPWQDAVRMAAEVSAALAAAHARGLVHRDVKPGNVMLTPVGVKVLDFGIAAAVGTPDEGNVLLGTPAYVAPERLAGGPVHPAADVYAVGLLLYKALVGRLPWVASTATQVLRSHRNEDPEPLPEIPGMPPEVAALCMRCLAKKPAARPDSATLSRHLAALVHARVTVPAPGNPPADNLADRTAAFGRVRRWVAGLRDRPMLTRTAAGATGLGAVALALGWAMVPASDDGTRATMVFPAGGADPVSCSLAYRTTLTGAEGFRVDLAIRNTGQETVPSWALSFDLPDGQTVTGGTGARWSQDGGTVRARGTGTRSAIAPGATETVAYTGTASNGRVKTPTRFVLNGATCSPGSVTAVADAAGSQGKRSAAGHGAAGQGAGHGQKIVGAPGYQGTANGKGKGKGTG